MSSCTTMTYQQSMYPGTIMQKIEELREWQRQQQEKLLQQQEEQRILLNTEQQRIYQEFGLPDRGNDEQQQCLYKALGLPDEGTSSKQKEATTYADTPQIRSWLDSTSEDSLDDTEESLSSCDAKDMSSRDNVPTTPKFQKKYSSGSAHDEESSPFMSTRQRNLNLDDTPVNSAKKNFHQLLQEKLDKFGGGDSTVNQFPPKNKNEKPKRKFLKKGEGIARFKMKPRRLETHPQTNNKLTTNKKSTVPTLSTTNVKTGQIKKNNAMKTKQTKEKASNQAVKSAEVSKPQYPKTAVSKLTLKKSDSCPVVGTWAHVLQQRNGTARTTDVHKSHVASLQEKDPMNNSGKDAIELSFLEKIYDAEKKNKKEVEELKIFELLEQQAENSSFCSTSSLVARLMEGSINSTPVKNHEYCSRPYHNDRVLSPKQSKSPEKLVSRFSNLPGKSTILGYLPFGLDTEEVTKSVLHAETTGWV